MFDLEGILAPVFTPMNDSGSINLEVIPEYMAYLNKHKIKGILVGGTTGEAMSLTVEERKTVLEAWIRETKKTGTKVIAQIGGTCLPDVLILAKHAEQLEVDCILTLPELYYKARNVEQLVSYLKTVSDAAPTLPILYYHFPMMTGVDVDMRKFFSLASSTIPNFKGAKADLEIAEMVTDQLAKDQKIFIANHKIAPAVLMGHHSFIATVSNMFPELVKNIVKAIKDSDTEKANILQKKMNRLVVTIASHGDFVSSMKTAMELVTNITMGPSRCPLVSLDKNKRATLKNALSTFDI